MHVPVTLASQALGFKSSLCAYLHLLPCLWCINMVPRTQHTVTQCQPSAATTSPTPHPPPHPAGVSLVANQVGGLSLPQMIDPLLKTRLKGPLSDRAPRGLQWRE